MLMLERMRPYIRMTGVVAVLLLLLSLVFQPKPIIAAGTPSPTVVGTTVDGAAFDTRAWLGRVVVVNIWATWCTPCIIEMPGFQRFAQAHPEVAVVGLAAESEPAAIARMVQKTGVTYPIVAIGDDVQTAWRVQGLPSTYILDAQGFVQDSVAGAISESELAKRVAAVQQQAR
jgi:thiol-disulfide isomerase/thioredoxin